MQQVSKVEILDRGIIIKYKEVGYKSKDVDKDIIYKDAVRILLNKV